MESIIECALINYLSCVDSQTCGRYFDLLISIELQKNPEIPLSKWKVFCGLPENLISEWKLNETFIFFRFFESNSACDAFEVIITYQNFFFSFCNLIF